MSALDPHDYGALRRLLVDAFHAGLEAVNPVSVVPPALPAPSAGRTFVVGAGKASAAMARAIETSWTPDLSGLVVVPHGHGVPCEYVEVIEAAHPVPDSFGSAAARRMLDLVGAAGKNDLVLAVFSGGGSSLLPLPAHRLTLDDKQSITRQLLRAGAPISDINCLRKHLSAVKGGRLAQAAQPATFVNILISDVPGDDPSLIASGPGVPDPSTLEEAREVISAYGLQVTEAVRRHLTDERNETPKPDDVVFARVRTEVVACARTFLEASASFLAKKGFAACILSDRVEGEARLVAEEQASLLRQIAADEVFAPPYALLSGGETTVTVRGQGRGGPNMEFVLALGDALGDTTRYAAISCDTDGSDGSTSAAGALLLPDTGARAAEADLLPKRFLDANDSQSFFEQLGDLVVTGPTLNNVNDFRALLVLPTQLGDGLKEQRAAIPTPNVAD